jgi:hypothetical protein
MAKNGSPTDEHRNGVVRERAQVSGEWVKRDSNTGVRREILFPTEPSTIGHKKIDRAIERVVSRKK